MTLPPLPLFSRPQLSAVAWLVGAALAAVIAPHFATTLSYLGGTQLSTLPVRLMLSTSNSQELHHFWHWFYVLSQTTAIAISILCVHSLWVSFKTVHALNTTKTINPTKADPNHAHEHAVSPITAFFEYSRFPCMIMGCVLIAAVLVSYSMKQGYDARHLYLLGIATAGVAIMFIVATIAFAILLGPSKSAEAKPKTTKASTQITLCVLQAFGTAALIWLFVLPLSAVLVAALNAA